MLCSLLMLCSLCNSFACFAVEDFSVDTIRIGLLVQDKKSIAARQGAELAIRSANLKTSNTFFELVVSDMEGPWGKGARESVNLVFDKDVWAVVGAVDGRNAHLAEQVAAKTTVPFISALSGDPTLGQAFIPWFFSCVPNDLQTAGVLIGEAVKNDLKEIIIVSGTDYDSKMAASSFIKKCSSEKRKNPDIIYYNENDSARDFILMVEKTKSADCVVFFGKANVLVHLSALLKANYYSVILAPYLIMDEKVSLNSSELNNVIILSPGEFIINKNDSFVTNFIKAYQKQPGAIEAYAFDAINIVIQGIRQSGNDRSSLYKNISKINYRGATGEISFDASGNRKVPPGLMKIYNGKFLKIED